jgi:hypothetical protein
VLIIILPLNIVRKASACWVFLSFDCLRMIFWSSFDSLVRFGCMIFWSSFDRLVRFGCFRVTLFSVCLRHKFRVQRSVRTYADISGGDRCEMSAMSISVSEAEWHGMCPFRRAPLVRWVHRDIHCYVQHIIPILFVKLLALIVLGWVYLYSHLFFLLLDLFGFSGTRRRSMHGRE